MTTESNDKVLVIPAIRITKICLHRPPQGIGRFAQWKVVVACGCKIVSGVVSLSDSVLLADDLPAECVRCGKPACAVEEHYPKKKEEVSGQS